jgi:hypothetical protein
VGGGSRRQTERTRYGRFWFWLVESLRAARLRACSCLRHTSSTAPSPDHRRSWCFVGLHPGNSATHPKAHLPDLRPEVCSAWHGAWAVSAAWARRDVNAHAFSLHPRSEYVGAEPSPPPVERLCD